MMKSNKSKLIIAALVGGMSSVSLVASASDLAIPNTFSGGTPAVAAEVNANFSAIETAVVDNDTRINANKSSTDSQTTLIEANAGGVSTNAGNITVNQGAISTNVDAITANNDSIVENASNISINVGDISALGNAVTLLDGAVNNLSTSSGALDDRVTSIEQALTTLTSEVSSISDVVNMLGCSVLTQSASFDYTQNGGIYSIGAGSLLFDTKWSPRSPTSVWAYNDPANIEGVARAPVSTTDILQIIDATVYDMSLRSYGIDEGGIAVLKNTTGNYAVLKVLDVKTTLGGDLINQLTFDYCILPNGKTNFSK